MTVAASNAVGEGRAGVTVFTRNRLALAGGKAALIGPAARRVHAALDADADGRARAGAVRRRAQQAEAARNAVVGIRAALIVDVTAHAAGRGLVGGAAHQAVAAIRAALAGRGRAAQEGVLTGVAAAREYAANLAARAVRVAHAGVTVDRLVDATAERALHFSFGAAGVDGAGIGGSDGRFVDAGEEEDRGEQGDSHLAMIGRMPNARPVPAVFLLIGAGPLT